jgi:hypothetical protein
MTRIERKALKRKIKRQYWIATGLLLFTILFLVTLFTTPLIELFRAPEGTELTDGQMLIRIGFIIVFTVVPMFIAMWFNGNAGLNQRALYEERNRLHKKQLRMYTEWFLEAIVQEDYKKAIDLHNEFIWGDTKSLTRGILIGYLFKSGNRDDAVNALKHLSKIPEEVYSENI